MSQYIETIRKDIPFMSSTRRMLKLHDMEIGDSYLFVNAAGASIRSEVCKESKLLGWKFRTRETNQGVRVWRIN